MFFIFFFSSHLVWTLGLIRQGAFVVCLTRGCLLSPVAHRIGSRLKDTLDTIQGLDHLPESEGELSKIVTFIYQPNGHARPGGGEGNTAGRAGGRLSRFRGPSLGRSYARRRKQRLEEAELG